MSAPAAKAFAEPVRIMAAISGDWSKAWRAWLSSLMRGVERAFRALGRLRVTGVSISCQFPQVQIITCFDRPQDVVQLFG
jgi:hypothetical protein